MGKTSKPHIPALTGIRAVAAYFVFLHHYPYLSLDTLFGCMLNHLYLGVTMFFVLSGFVIAYNYFDSVELNKGWFVEYFKNRVARIYPLYFFLLLIQGTPLGGGIGYWISNLTLTKGFSATHYLDGISPAWSLTVEETFYFLAPFIFYYLSSKPFKIRYYLKLLLAGYITAHVLVGFGRLILWQGLFEDVTFTLFYTFFGRILEFLTGIFLARLLQHRKITMRLDAKIKAGFPKVTTLGVIALLLVDYLLARNFMAGNHFRYNIPWLHNLTAPIAIALLYYGILTEGSLLRSILSSRLFNLLGKSSYAFYLIHAGYVSGLITSLFGSHGILPHFILLNLAAILLYYYIESPMQRLIRNFKLSSIRWLKPAGETPPP
jgi:peptidoglycan/LPS O-acetylase OafA/YrhL